MTAAPIRSERLLLVPIGGPMMRALLDGDRATAEALATYTMPTSWPGDDVQGLRFRLADLERDPEAGPWLLRAMVLAATGEMIGHIGFHGPPEDGVAEIGYTVFEPHRRQGFAAEAFGAMMQWASEQGVTRFRLSIAPENEPSLAIASRFGFVQVGEQIDEIDGLELVFELERAG